MEEAAAKKRSVPRAIERRIEKIRAWEGDDPARRRKTYWRLFTLLFIVVSAAALFVYILNGRSLVWDVDGMEQYYPFFIYEGQWLREVVGGFFAGNGLQIPLWTLNLGYGSDIPAVLDTFFDPLNLLSGLCPEHLSEYLYQFLIVARLYLAGVAFSLYSLRMGNGRFPTLCGAILYSLCGTALGAIIWPTAAWPLILFPLLLLGVEKILAGERPYLFIMVIAAFFIITYYFSYMACLFLLPYCAARVIVTQKGIRPGRFILWTGKFLGYLVIGICLAGFALFPALTKLFGIDRFTGGTVESSILYSFTYYIETAAGFLGFAEVGSDCYIGFGGLAVIACLALFATKGEHKLLKAAFIAATAVLLLPAAGSVLNGFNYATNRWVWAYVLIVCFIIAKMLPAVLALDARQKKRIIVASVVIGLFVFMFPQARLEKTLVAFALMLAMLLVVTGSNLSDNLKKAGVFGVLAVGIACSTFYFVDRDEGGFGYVSAPVGSMYATLTSSSPNAAVAAIEDEGTWRYDADPSVTSRKRNNSLVLGLAGIDFYNSAYNSYVDQYHTELGLAGTDINFSYKHLGGRSYLEALAGVKYYLVQKGMAWTYNYRGADAIVSSGAAKGVDYDVYEADESLPLAYTYAECIPREAYDAMTPADKQEALMQGVVLEGDCSLDEADAEFLNKDIAYEVVAANGVTVEDGAFVTSRDQATMQLQFEGLPDAETYLSFSGLDFSPSSPLDTVREEDFETMTWYQKASLLKKDIEWKGPTNYRIAIDSDKGAKGRVINNWLENYHLYGGKDDWLICLGYTEEAQSMFTVTFSKAGRYSYDSMKVVCQPMEGFSEDVAALKEDPVEDLEISTNRITASVDLSQEKAVFFSIPYSMGWSAAVDGEPVEIKRANTAFMALEVPAGKHDIELTYCTPGLGKGMLATGAGVLVLVGLIAFYRFRGARRKTKRMPANEEGRSL